MMKNKNTSTSSWDGLNCICLNFTVNRPFFKGLNIFILPDHNQNIVFIYHVISARCDDEMPVPFYADDIAAEVGAYVDIPQASFVQLFSGHNFDDAVVWRQLDKIDHLFPT